VFVDSAPAGIETAALPSGERTVPPTGANRRAPPGVEGGGRIFTVVCPDTPGAFAIVAVTVTIPPAGIVKGAVYNPAAVIMPVLRLPPATPLTLQFTDVDEEETTPVEN
jgi:hypothetical protein